MQRTTGWAVYAIFAGLAVATAWNEQTLVFDGAQGVFKAAIWLLLLGFLVYSVYCSLRENIFRTIRTMSGLHWGRQIGLDLYLGLLIFMAFIYLHQGAMLPVALWLLPVLLFANLATLLYLAIHFDSILNWLLI